jgi:hypothetical protein
MKESEDHDCIVVLFRNGYKVKVIVLVEIEEVVVLIFDDRSI